MEIDPRRPRTAALITTAVLAAVLITGSGWLLAVQALGRPRLGPPRELESEAPPLESLEAADA